jgi:exopolysaccharide biosynthesis WecB/TagA/CpsF family protein
VALGVLLALGAAPFLAAALYLLVLAVALAGAGGPPPVPARPAQRRLVVLVPAHDEEALVARCVRSLLDQTYPRQMYEVLVVADNCSDGTAAAARAAGANVLERRDEAARGKGRALRWAMDRVLASDRTPEAIVVVDADSVADRGLLAGLAEQLTAGAVAVQAEYLILVEEDSPRARLLEAAFLLFHRVRLGGRAALGLPVNLVGNGMLFSRHLLESLPWNAFTGVEDLEYSVNLRLAGFRPRYAARALVRGPVPRGYSGMRGQRMRWEGGRFHVVRSRLPHLLGHALRNDPRLLDAALDLAVPPLGLLLVALLAGTLGSGLLAALGPAPFWAALPWALGLAFLFGFVTIGLRAARAPRSAYLALLEAPRYLLWKLLTYCRLARGFDPARWERAQRTVGPASTPSPPPAKNRVEIAGVPLDRVDLSEAVRRLSDAVEERRQVQVATVNLDFLVTAHRNSDFRDLLSKCELNVADGKPVVWLSRLLGHSLPERVPGSDLVPLLASQAARSGARVFLLGGEAGAGEAAARRLAADNPGLQLAGWLEPPRASLDEMANEQILEIVKRSRPDILLVALGNPKQEFWIARHRHLLAEVAVLIGVGCVFDLLAGRQSRAPLWMQRSGLEWLHRLGAEPRRLAGRYLGDAAWLLLASTRILVGRATRRAPGSVEPLT